MELQELDVLKKKRNVIIKIVKVEFCYKEFKYSRKEIPEDICPFGLVEFDKEKCNHCRFVAEKILSTKEE